MVTTRSQDVAEENGNGVKADTAGEKIAREQLRNASISKPQELEAAAEATKAVQKEEPIVDAEADKAEDHTLLKKKRSFEDMDTTQQETSEATQSEHKTTHTRKRSRDTTAEATEPNGKRQVSSEKSKDTDPKVIEPDRDGMVAAATGKGKRAATPESPNLTGNEDVEEAVASPKTKRSRLHSATIENGTLETKEPPPAPRPGHAEIPGLDKKEESLERTTVEGVGEETMKVASTKIPPASGFGNTSATSSFGALGGTRSPTKSPPPAADPPQTAPSAFAASGFSALSGSSTSGFGSIGKTTGGFGSGGSFATKSPPSDSDKKESDGKDSTSTFGGALGQKSAFASTASSETSAFGSGSASGFGKLGGGSGFGSGGSGFGSGLGGFGSAGPGLSSFASGKPSASTFKTAKPFGASADDDEDKEAGSDNDDDDASAGLKSPLAVEEEPKDERFYEQSLETGEEDEEKIYDCRAKLYTWATVENDEKDAATKTKKEWRERGFGILRLNVRPPKDEEGEDAKPKARFVLRAMGSHRVVLNTPVKKELGFGTPKGDRPTGGNVFLMGTVGEGVGLELLQLKMKPQYAIELYDLIEELKERL